MNNLQYSKEQYDTRIMVLLAGYNKNQSKFKDFLKNISNKIHYNEILIDTKDKANLVLDESKNKRVIEYPLSEIEKISNLKTIIVGNKKELDKNLSDKYDSIENIVEQGNSFYENTKLGEEYWQKAYNKYTGEGKNVSPQVFCLFADTFYAKKNSIENAISTIEERDADFSFSYISKETDQIRDLFNYRPWGKLKDEMVRNANIGAVRKTTPDDLFLRGIPENREFLVQMGYDTRKLCNPKNIFQFGKTIGKAGFGMIFDYFTGNATLENLEMVLSDMLRCDFAFVKVKDDLELDIDSKKDYLRAREMVNKNIAPNSSKNILVEKKYQIKELNL